MHPALFNAERDIAALGERYGAPSKSLRTKDGLRNLELAALLDERPSPKLWLSDREQGTDGWLFWDDRDLEPVEIKTALEGNGFQIYPARAETVALLRRLASSAFLFAVAERDSQRIAEAIYLPQGSPLHWELEERLAWLERDGPPMILCRSKSVTIGRIRKERDAVRLV